MLYDDIRQVLNQRKIVHNENDFEIEKCQNKLINLLSINDLETIKCLEICNKDEILWISEVFEEVAEKLQSRRYIECLKKIDNKYPDLKLTKIIKIANNYIN